MHLHIVMNIHYHEFCRDTNLSIINSDNLANVPGTRVMLVLPEKIAINGHYQIYSKKMY